MPSAPGTPNTVAPNNMQGPGAVTVGGIPLPSASATPANPYANMPTMPGWTGDLNPDGTLNSQYAVQAQPDIQFQSNLPELQQQLSGIQLNQQPLQNLESFASSTGPSQWAQLQSQQQNLMQQNQLDSLGQQTAAGTGTADSNLAQMGGLSQGAAQNIALNAARGLATGRQSVQSQGQQAQLGISAQDAANKLNAAEQLPGQEVQSLQPALQETGMWSQLANSENQQQQQLAENQQQYQTGVNEFNTGNALQGLNSENNYNLNKYNTQMQGWAANQQANAQAASGGKK